jgi:cytoskeletal protein CcmA (bactofilin family)
MAIFSEKDQPAKPVTEQTKRRGSGQPSLSMIASDLKVIGDLETDGVVKIEGNVEGTIRAGTQVLVSEGALITGDIHSKEAIIGGEVRGVVHAEERVEIQATAMVNGDIVTKRIVVLEGGRVNGAVKMDGGSVAYPKQSSPAASVN